MIEIESLGVLQRANHGVVFRLHVEGAWEMTLGTKTVRARHRYQPVESVCTCIIIRKGRDVDENPASK